MIEMMSQSCGMRKTVWITGCSRGLGKSLVEGFLANQWQVVGCATSVEGMSGGFFQSVDVRDAARVNRFCKEAINEYGAPDLLVNNAGMINRPAPLWEVDEKDFDAVIDVNLKGVANMIRAVMPAMIARETGIVVNLSSGWGRSVSADVAPYCASKWGIEGLTAALAEELPRGLAAVALNPGIIDTDMLRKTWDEGAGNFPQAEEWKAIAVPFLEKLTVRDNGASLTVG